MHFVSFMFFSNLEPPGLTSSLTHECHANGSCTVAWEQPFSLNITNVHPDVVYTVALYKLLSTCDTQGYRKLMNETVIEKEFYEFPRPDFLYELFVIPRNNLEEAMNGSNKSFIG